MPIQTNAQAYAFARSLFEDFKVEEELAKFKQNVNSEGDVDAVQDTVEAASDPLRHVSEINYAKWEVFAETIKRDEELEKERKEAEAADYRRTLGGCAHDNSQERQIFEKPTEEKLLAAERFRCEGNVAYHDKNYGLAAVNYRKALLQFDYTFPDTEEDEKWMQREKLAAHLNMAACKLKQRDYEEALTQCRLALEIDSSNAKALYRRGLIYLALDDYDKAEKALEAARRVDPNDKTVSSAINTLKLKKNKYVVKRKRVYLKMFESQMEKERTEESSSTQQLAAPFPCASETFSAVSQVTVLNCEAQTIVSSKGGQDETPSRTLHETASVTHLDENIDASKTTDSAENFSAEQSLNKTTNTQIPKSTEDGMRLECSPYPSSKFTEAQQTVLKVPQKNFIRFQQPEPCVSSQRSASEGSTVRHSDSSDTDCSSTAAYEALNVVQSPCSRLSLPSASINKNSNYRDAHPRSMTQLYLSVSLLFLVIQFLAFTTLGYSTFYGTTAQLVDSQTQGTNSKSLFPSKTYSQKLNSCTSNSWKRENTSFSFPDSNPKFDVDISMTTSRVPFDWRLWVETFGFSMLVLTMGALCVLLCTELGCLFIRALYPDETLCVGRSSTQQLDFAD